MRVTVLAEEGDHHNRPHHHFDHCHSDHSVRHEDYRPEAIETGTSIKYELGYETGVIRMST